MKRFAILSVTLLVGILASASSVHYFTRSQANRTVDYLNRQKEVMIYCGYEYELETYVLVNEVWAEKVNSAYYELWIYGYDAYTGEEIYMPLDLQCVWLHSGTRMFNAAQYLRFRTPGLHTPSITWYIPAYRPFTRVVHRPGYVRTYHYDVHVYGWMPPARPIVAHGMPTPPPPPIHPYYMRSPHTPAPRPTVAWTPGVDRPHIAAPDAAGRTNSVRTGATVVNTGTPATSPAAPRSGAATSTPTPTNTRTQSSNNSRSGSTTTTPSRNNTTQPSSNSRSGSTTTTSSSRSSSTQPSSNSRSGSTTTTSSSRSSSTQPSSNSRSGSTTSSTPSRSNNSRSGASTSSRSGRR